MLVVELERTEVVDFYANGVSSHIPVLEKGWMPEVFRRHPTLGTDAILQVLPQGGCRVGCGVEAR